MRRAAGATRRTPSTTQETRRRHGRATFTADGFTLVEVLVVIALLGILTAIAVPMYLKDKGRAHDAAVKADIRNAIPVVEDAFTHSNWSDITTVAGQSASFNLVTGNPDTKIVVTHGDVLAFVNYGSGLYCIEGTSLNDPSTRYSFLSADGRTSDGDCPAGPPPSGGGGGGGGGGGTSTPVPLAQIKVGAGFTCGIGIDDNLYCWGNNAEDSMAVAGGGLISTPVKVTLPNGESARSVAMAGGEVCALSSAAKMYCWGEGRGSPGLGNDTVPAEITPTPTPVLLPDGSSVVAIAGAADHLCAVLSSGDAYCWGFNGNAQLGDGTTTARTLPTKVLLPAGVIAVDVSTGGDNGCVLTTTSAAYCWGWNNYDLLGDGTQIQRTSPVKMTTVPGGTFAQVALGLTHTCVVTTSATTYCWGYNELGQVGNGTNTSTSTPYQVTIPGGDTITDIADGDGGWSGENDHATCAVTTAGDVYCWGSNNYGQLGDGTTTPHSTPTKVALPAGVHAVSVTAGETQSCALTDTGNAYCWGSNNAGQLGDGTTTDSSTPVAVTLPTS